MDRSKPATRALRHRAVASCALALSASVLQAQQLAPLQTADWNIQEPAVGFCGFGRIFLPTWLVTDSASEATIPSNAALEFEPQAELPLLMAGTSLGLRLLLQTDDPTQPMLLDSEIIGLQPRTDDGLDWVPNVSMSIGRRTDLLNHSVSESLLTRPSPGFTVAEGDVDLYNLSLEWQALEPGPVQLSLLGGVRAIRTVGGLSRTEYRPGTDDQSPFLQTYDEQRMLGTLPMMGGGLHLNLADGISLRTQATTHTSEFTDAFYDLVMETAFDLGGGVGLSAGYQDVRSNLDEVGLAEPLRERGLFARLSISF